MNKVKDILQKLHRLATESSIEGERVAAKTAYDRIYTKYKDKENISDWDITNNELALLAKYDIKINSDNSLDVPKTNESIDMALTYLLSNWKKKRKVDNSRPMKLRTLKVGDREVTGYVYDDEVKEIKE